MKSCKMRYRKIILPWKNYLKYYLSVVVVVFRGVFWVVGFFCLLWGQLSFFKIPGFWMSISPIFVACKQERRKGCSLDGNCSPGLCFWSIFCLMQYKKQFELQNREKDSQGKCQLQFSIRSGTEWSTWGSYSPSCGSGEEKEYPLTSWKRN